MNDNCHRTKFFCSLPNRFNVYVTQVTQKESAGAASKSLVERDLAGKTDGSVIGPSLPPGK